MPAASPKQRVSSNGSPRDTRVISQRARGRVECELRGAGPHQLVASQRLLFEKAMVAIDNQSLFIRKQSWYVLDQNLQALSKQAILFRPEAMLFHLSANQQNACQHANTSHRNANSMAFSMAQPQYEQYAQKQQRAEGITTKPNNTSIRNVQLIWYADV